ncbi:MAG: PAS domain-containing protein [Deltaproteobacteria bacterium]|nr:PAS domain-containing protein [Deltaproteobacteria bacterium]
MKTSLRQSWVSLPPWIILGAVVVLAPIFVFWTFQNIRKQQEAMTLLMIEKGAALVRSFEAGTRTGMMGMMGTRAGGFQLQRLLMETARQPDIVHLIVTDTEGHVLAHSEPSRIGETYGRELDLERISHMEKPERRLLQDPSGKDTFEVFSRFAPARAPSRDHPGRMMQRKWQFDHPTLKEWDPEKGLVIFVGLDREPVKEAQGRDIRHRVLMALVLLLIGFAGIVLLFLAQAYRTTRSSLTRIKAFSDKVVESMPIGLITLDGDGRIVTVNQAAETVLRTPPGRLAGKGMEGVIPPGLSQILNEMGTEKKILSREIECPLQDGRALPLDVSASTLEDEDGSPLGHIILFRDLTEVQDLKREVETSKRLASLGRLAAGVAHEIRNPLSTLKGFATYFKERYRDVPEDRSTADIMIQEVDRLNRVISQLLEFARPITVQKKLASPLTLIHHSLKMIEQQADQKGIRIRADLPEDMRKVPMDPDRMSQVLLNIYLNALEAMQEGGTLSVRLSPGYGDRSMEISVTDTGAGIKKEDLSHIFDPYFTTRPSGTGLGLAIVHRIIESHQGEIRVESEEGRGTSVTILLPGGDS